MNMNSKDVYALSVMQPILGGPYLPFTNSVIRPSRLVHILNDMVVNSRRTILEFGSGISTILMGRLIRKNNTGAQILSIEHDQHWADLVRSAIRNEQMEDIISVVHAPLQPNSFAIGENLWYGLDIHDRLFAGFFFDMVVVDGPPAYEASKEFARYPALPFIHDRLAGQSTIFLDDADRNGEKWIIQQWEREFSIQFRILADSLAYASRGTHFNMELFT